MGRPVPTPATRPTPARFPDLDKLADTLEWVPVTSSNVKSVAYHDFLKLLFVTFHSGSRYAYEGVPRGVYEGLLAAPSKGSYLYYVIRGKADGNYPCYRVD